MGVDVNVIARRIGLKPAQAEGLIYLLLQGPVDNRDLLRTTGLPKSILADFKNEISPFLVKPGAVTALNKKGQAVFRELSPHPFVWQPCWAGRYPSSMKNILGKYWERRPQAKRVWDQFHATQETVFERALLLKGRGDVDSRRLLFIGDADLTSVAVAALGGARRIFVVDIDGEVLKFIKEIATKEQLAIETLRYDVRRPLPPHLSNVFDVVFTDPPYTESGVSLFLSRAITALDLGLSSSLYFCYGQSGRARERSFEIQAAVTDMGLLIEGRLDKFNRYSGAASIGSASALYINSITVKTKPAVTGSYKGKIYTWEKRVG